MKIIMTAASAAVLAAGAVPAFAGGMAEPVVAPAPVAPAPVVAPDGDWTGFSVGASLGFGDSKFGGNNENGAVYGLRAAYDYDFGKFVLGAVGSYDWTSIDSGGNKLNSIGRLGLRGGVDLGSTYVYATGGAAWIEAGWFAGVGAEHKLTGNWTVGGEILTNQVNDFKSSGDDLKATTFALNVGLRF
jgi:outer membrane immunogenic protein